jgi:quinol monooxygenase YgiN
MISFTVRYRFAPEDREKIAALLAELAIASRQEPGCVTYVPHTVEGDPDTVVIYEQYRDSAALDAHRSAGHFQKLVIGGLYQWMRDRQAENLNALL